MVLLARHVRPKVGQDEVDALTDRDLRDELDRCRHVVATAALDATGPDILRGLGPLRIRGRGRGPPNVEARLHRPQSRASAARQADVLLDISLDAQP